MYPFNSERLPQKILRDPYALGNVCTELAFRLSGNRWHEAEVRSVDFNRSIVDEIGAAPLPPGSNVDEDEKSKKRYSVQTTTYTEFTGEKIEDKNADGDVIDLEYYTIAADVRDTIDESEMPSFVLDDIFESYGYLYDESITADEAETVMEYAKRDALDELEIERELHTEYGVDDEDGIQRFTTEYAYYFNGERMHVTEYNTDEWNAVDGDVFEPITIHGTGEIVELRPKKLEGLNKKVIKREVKNFNAAFQRLMHESAIEDELKLGGPNTGEHVERALGMLSLLTSGIFDVRDLATGKQL